MSSKEKKDDFWNNMILNPSKDVSQDVYGAYVEGFLCNKD